MIFGTIYNKTDKYYFVTLFRSVVIRCSTTNTILLFNIYLTIFVYIYILIVYT